MLNKRDVSFYKIKGRIVTNNTFRNGKEILAKFYPYGWYFFTNALEFHVWKIQCILKLCKKKKNRFECGLELDNLIIINK